MTAVRVLTGDFARTPLAEVLQVLHMDKETATLVCRNQDKKRALFLWRGQVSDVESNVAGEGLGEMLHSMGKLTDEDLARVRDHDGGNKSQAQLIVELGIAAPREVITFIRIQIVGVLNGLFEESFGVFKLILGEVPDRGFSVRIPVPELIITGVKQIPTFEKLAGYLGNLDRRAVLQPGKALDKSWRLGPEEEALVQTFKSRPTYHSMLEKNPAQRREVAALLYAMEVLGLLTPYDKKKGSGTTELRRMRAVARKEEERTEALAALPRPEFEAARLPKPGSLADELEAAETPAAEEAATDLDAYAELDTMTHYQVLQIDGRATESDVRGAYFRLAKVYHPDRFFGQSAELTTQVRRIFEAQSRAYNTLKDAAQRRDYDRALETKRQGKLQPEAAKESEEVVRGRINYQHAVQAIEVKNYQAAVDALHRATDANPTEPRYWATLAEVQSRFARWKNDALVAIQKALELKPDQPEYLYLLGLMLSRQPDYDGAARVLRRATTLDRGNEKYKQLLDEVEAKGGGKKSRGKPGDKGGLFGRIFGSGKGN